MSDASVYQQLRGHLATLRLTAAAEALPGVLEQARSERLGPTALLEHPRQRLRGGRQAQRGEVAAQLLVDRGVAHRTVSTSSA